MFKNSIILNNKENSVSGLEISIAEHYQTADGLGICIGKHQVNLLNLNFNLPCKMSLTYIRKIIRKIIQKQMYNIFIGTLRPEMYLDLEQMLFIAKIDTVH